MPPKTWCIQCLIQPGHLCYPYPHQRYRESKPCKFRCTGQVPPPSQRLTIATRSYSRSHPEFANGLARCAYLPQLLLKVNSSSTDHFHILLTWTACFVCIIYIGNSYCSILHSHRIRPMSCIPIWFSPLSRCNYIGCTKHTEPVQHMNMKWRRSLFGLHEICSAMFAAQVFQAVHHPAP